MTDAMNVNLEAQPTRILVVDDLPEKLFIYRTILESPALQVITASSGQEALRHLLTHDFAVILLDVNMPTMDGYETAQLIRSRRRSAHTPIIFVTAYADEVHALKGYSYGAVDYILSPVVPDVLRTKVNVFADLHRLTQQTRETAARQVAVAERERARLSAVLETSSDLVARLDEHGRLRQVNPAGLRLLGFRSDDLPQRLDGFAPGDERMESARAEGIWFGETTLESAVGSHIPVSLLLLAHRSDQGSVDSWSIIARDITEQRRADRAKSYLAAIVESSEDAIIGKTLDGTINAWNAGAERLYGYSADEMIGQSVLRLIPPDRTHEEQQILSELRAGRRVAPFETVRVRRDGSLIDVSLSISPIFDKTGNVIGASKVARDISARKRVEDELAEHRTRLEHLVEERTAELEASHERLRLSDRLASIGTLAAGLGHDMGNLLLPIRARLASLEALELPTEAREHLLAIKTAGEYLKRLSQGLRLFALDPAEASTGAVTFLPSWWLEVEPLMRNALQRRTTIQAELAEPLPPVRMPPHAFTQVIFNLVQNAGDAMREQADGVVRFSAAASPDGSAVIVSVSDNGPGMSDEVRARCLEPFFTTRPRGISTGLGLALVRGAVHNINGSIEIQSKPGAGTTFRLTLPAAAAEQQRAGALEHTGKALVHVANNRMAAYIASLLRGLGLDVTVGAFDPAAQARVIVLDARQRPWHEVRTYLESESQRRALMLGDRNGTMDHPQAVWLDDAATPQQMRAALGSVLTSTRQTQEAVPT